MTPLPWHEVELAIQNEERWLNELFDFGPYKEAESRSLPPQLSADKMLRQLALAIVNGKIIARELKSTTPYGLWVDDTTTVELLENTSERHGDQWHQTMMSIIKQHFVQNNFEVINEPYLSLGRADLGVYKKGYENLYIEIGTTSLYKTWLNTTTMLGSIFLFVPSTTYAIELITSGGNTTETTHREFHPLKK